MNEKTLNAFGDEILDLGPPTDYITVRRHIQRGRRLQSQMFESVGRAIFAGIVSLVRRIAGAIACRRLRAQTLRDLSRLDDHILRDIGISRDQIHLAAAGIIRAAPTGPRSVIEGGRCAQPKPESGAGHDKLAA